ASHATELAEALAGVTKDAFSLAQAGCLSTRLLVVTGARDMDADVLASKLVESARGFWRAELPSAARLGFDFETWRLRRLGFTPHLDERVDAPFIATRKLSMRDISARLILD